MATKTSLTENQKIALGVVAVVAIGGIAYIVLKGKLGEVTVTASSSNPSAASINGMAPLVNGTWTLKQIVEPDGSSTVTATFHNVSTWLLEVGTMTGINFPYPLIDYKIVEDTTGLLDVPTEGLPWAAFSLGLDHYHYLARLLISGGAKVVINGTVVIKGIVPEAYRPGSATTKTSSGTYG